MVINTVVTESFEISNITFAENYQSAKEHRLDLFNKNIYTTLRLKPFLMSFFIQFTDFWSRSAKLITNF
jgi:hypothetical protein